MDWSSLHEEYPDIAKRLNRHEENLKKADIDLDLKDHAGVERLLEELKNRVEVINVALLTAKMTEQERDLLLERKSCWLWLEGRFTSAEHVKNNIERYIKSLSV